jgi:hypothetical protein
MRVLQRRGRIETEAIVMPVSGPDSVHVEHTCETCGDPISGPPAISAEGDAFCAVCTASLLGAEVERLREAGDRLRRTLDINLGCGHVDARAPSHDDCPYCRAKRSALDAWDIL